MTGDARRGLCYERVSSPRLRPHVRNQHAFRISLRALAERRRSRPRPGRHPPAGAARRRGADRTRAQTPDRTRRGLRARRRRRRCSPASTRLPRPNSAPSWRGVSEAFGPDLAALQEAARAFLEAPDAAHAADLLARAEPTRQELIRRLNHAPGGTLALVRMRETLLAALQGRRAAGGVRPRFPPPVRLLVQSRLSRAAAHRMDDAGQHPGKDHPLRGGARNLELGRAAPPPRSARPAAVRVLPSGADRRAADLRRGRADRGRFPTRSSRCSPPTACRSRPRRRRRRCSIRSPTRKRGLAGVSFGNFLIKQVVEDLRRELPRLQTFVTLSPVPGFARWLARGARQGRLALRRRGGARGSWRRSTAGETPGGAERTLSTLAAAYFLQARTPKRARRSTRWRGSISATARGWSASTRAATVSRGGPAAIARRDGQLSLRPRRDRGQSRGLRQPGNGGRLGGGAASSRRRSR